MSSVVHSSIICVSGLIISVVSLARYSFIVISPSIFVERYDPLMIFSRYRATLLYEILFLKYILIVKCYVCQYIFKILFYIYYCCAKLCVIWLDFFLLHNKNACR